MTDYCALREALIQRSTDCSSDSHMKGPQIPCPAPNRRVLSDYLIFDFEFFCLLKISKQITSNKLTATECFFLQEYPLEFCHHFVLPICPKTLKVKKFKDVEAQVKKGENKIQVR